MDRSTNHELFCPSVGGVKGGVSLGSGDGQGQGCRSAGHRPRRWGLWVGGVWCVCPPAQPPWALHNGFSMSLGWTSGIVYGCCDETWFTWGASCWLVAAEGQRVPQPPSFLLGEPRRLEQTLEMSGRNQRCQVDGALCLVQPAVSHPPPNPLFPSLGESWALCLSVAVRIVCLKP